MKEDPIVESLFSIVQDVRRLAAENDRLRAALEEIAFIDGPQSRGIPRRTSMGAIARKALGDDKPFEDRWDNA